MTRRAIVEVGHPVLRERGGSSHSRSCARLSCKGLDGVIETMRATDGAGLGANEVGETLRIAVAGVRHGNPRYSYKPPIPLNVIVDLFVDRVTDPSTLSTWAQFERFHQDAFVEPARRLVEWVGS